MTILESKNFNVIESYGCHKADMNQAWHIIALFHRSNTHIHCKMANEAKEK